MLCSSVKSFLRAWVDEELDFNFKLSLSNEEMMDKQNEEAMALEDMRKIYNECQSNRDRALILVAANGVAPEEMIQFTQRWKEWFPKNTEDLKAPFRVKLVRVKKQFPYHLTLFEDACEALKALYEERREAIAKGEQMFISEIDSKGKPTPFLYTTYGYVWENLRNRTPGMDKKQPNGRWVVHPHGVRHFFKTESKKRPVDQAAVEYAMGHNGDDYGYDKSSYRDEQWCKKVETELSKMTDVLNLKTGHASAYYATKEEELKAKILKDFHQNGDRVREYEARDMDGTGLETLSQEAGSQGGNLGEPTVRPQKVQGALVHTRGAQRA